MTLYLVSNYFFLVSLTRNYYFIIIYSILIIMIPGVENGLSQSPKSACRTAGLSMRKFLRRRDHNSDTDQKFLLHSEQGWWTRKWYSWYFLILPRKQNDISCKRHFWDNFYEMRVPQFWKKKKKPKKTKKTYFKVRWLFLPSMLRVVKKSRTGILLLVIAFI